MALIKCKHIKHATQKELMDLITHIIPIVVALQWKKKSKKLQKLIKNKMPRNGKMCKDKWNEIKFLTSTRVLDTTPYWKLTTDNRDK
jgi:hypothetical protein